MTTQPPAPKTVNPAGDDADEDSERASFLDRMPPFAVGSTVFVLVLVFTLGFIWLTKETFEAADGGDPGWSRRLYVFQSLFAIVTAIVGAIFSATVYRPQLKKAAVERRKAESRAENNARQAGSANERAERRAAETRERILEEALKRRRQVQVVRPEVIEDPDLRASFVRNFQASDDLGYMPSSAADQPPDLLTIDDLSAAIAATRSTGPQASPV